MPGPVQGRLLLGRVFSGPFTFNFMNTQLTNDCIELSFCSVLFNYVIHVLVCIDELMLGLIHLTQLLECYQIFLAHHVTTGFCCIVYIYFVDKQRCQPFLFCNKK